MSSQVLNAVLVSFSNVTEAFKRERPESALVVSIEKIVKKMEETQFKSAQDVSYVMSVINDAKACLEKMACELPSESSVHQECKKLVSSFLQINEDKINNIPKNFRSIFNAQANQSILKNQQKKFPLASR